MMRVAKMDKNSGFPIQTTAVSHFGVVMINGIMNDVVVGSAHPFEIKSSSTVLLNHFLKVGSQFCWSVFNGVKNTQAQVSVQCRRHKKSPNPKGKKRATRFSNMACSQR